jgi:hypothetical protein
MIGSGIPINQSKTPFPKDIVSLQCVNDEEETSIGSVGSIRVPIVGCMPATNH